MIGSLWIRFRRGVERLITGQSLQGRLALLTGVSVAFAVLLVGGTSYFITRWSLLDQLDHELLSAARSVAADVSRDIDSLANAATPGTGSSGQIVALVSSVGDIRQVPGQDLVLAAGPEEITISRTQLGYSARSTNASNGAPYRVVSVPLRVGDAEYSLMLGRALDPLSATLRSLWLVIVIAGLVGVLVTTVAMRLVAQAALTPVRRLSTAVRNVTQTDQLNPIRIYGRDDLGELTKSFNAMLRSLQTSREQQRQLIADAGHELRTPLTSMRTNIELLVADDRSGMLPEGARSEILDDVSAQLGEFSALVGDLVALTRDDHLQRAHEPLDLAEVVEAALERAKRRGPLIIFDIDLDHTQLVGDASTLERAITNLLDNAIKFSPPAGMISVRLHDGVLTIIDEGPGIAEEDLPHIFDRFYRSDRARNTPGTGLGLSIVLHTAEAHGATVRAGNEPGRGAKFTIRFPVVDVESILAAQ